MTTTDDDGASAAIVAAIEQPLLRNRYQINHEAHLPAFDTPSSGAYAVTDRRNPDRALFALLCQPRLPQRADTISRLRKAAPPGLLPIVDAGAIDWPLEKCRMTAIVYRRPAGGPLTDVFNGSATAVNEHEIPRRIIAPIVRGLRSLETIGLTHRAIRPDNLFFLDELRTDLVLGDCASSPCGYDQPVLFEPLERAMAMPAGRGEGRLSDDIYALGVTLAVLLCGLDAVDLGDDDTIIRAKLTAGSFHLLCENKRIPLAMVEPFRGLLADDPAQRWTLANAEAWLSGQRQHPPRKLPQARPAAPLTFAGNDYYDLRSLAFGLSGNPSEAAQTVRSGILESWLTQRCKRPDLAASVSDVLATTASRRDSVLGSDDYLVARITTLLDPAGPVRYRDFRFMPDGLGPAFAWAVLIKGDRQTPSEAMAFGLAELAARLPGSSASNLHKRQIDELTRLIQRRDLGSGIERCLYAANPGLACQSPLVVGAHVIEGDGLLLALEAAAGGHTGLDLPMDRHLAAFVASRYEDGVAKHIAKLDDADEWRRITAVLGLFAFLQRTHSIAALPGLAAWIGRSLETVVMTFQSRKTRDAIQRQIPRLIERGRLPELLDLLENRRKRDADHHGAAIAAAEYAAAERRIHDIETGEVDRRARSTVTGLRAAAWIGATIGFAVTTVSVLSRIW